MQVQKRPLLAYTPLNHLWRVFARIPVSLRQGVLYALALFLSKGVGFLMIPVFTRFLDPADYGRLDILQTLADLLSIVLIMGMSEALFKFYGEAKGKDAQRRIAANIFGLCLVICGLSFLVFQMAAPMIAKMLPGDITLWQVRFILVSLSVSSCLLIPLCWYRMQDQAGRYFLAASGRVLLQATGAALLLLLGFGVTGVMAAGALAALCCTILCAYDFWRRVGVGFDFAYWGRFTLYGAPLILTGLAGFVLGSFDRLLLADAIGPGAMALYALAAKFGLLTILLMQPFDLWWSPKRFAVLHDGEQGAKACARTISLGLVCVVLAVIAVAGAAPVAITIMTPPSYHDAMMYVPYLAGLGGIHAATQLMNIGLYNVRVTKWPAIIDVGAALVAFGGYMILIPLYGAWGAIFATAFALSLRFVVSVGVSQRLTPLPYRGFVLLGLLGFGGVAVLILAQEMSLVMHIISAALLGFGVMLYALRFGLMPWPHKMIALRGGAGYRKGGEDGAYSRHS